MEIMVKDKYSLVSIITMIAPSPDWFVGIDSVNLCGSNGWEQSVERSLPAWDGGSDTGLGFESGNEMTMPHDLVKLLTGANAQAAYGKITITMMKEDDNDKNSGSHRPSAGIYTLLSVAFVTILRFLY
ncbi:Spondin-2 [Desmophyllum pertusum]|uniref:Spondin-2 n=1 Tax=Desmophyllum pertusum TaxID=174260 RepID=A0A9X0CK84_9CNID|nr:Spondin-2 [Desmophyllum pertusum]